MARTRTMGEDDWGGEGKSFTTKPKLHKETPAQLPPSLLERSAFELRITNTRFALGQRVLCLASSIALHALLVL